MTDPARALLAQAPHDLDARWQHLEDGLEARFGRRPALESILFLIGVQARGQGYEPQLEKEAKQDLIMEGTACAFEAAGLYTRLGAGPDGRALWQRVGPPPVGLSLDAQETVLRLAVLAWFARHDPSLTL